MVINTNIAVLGAGIVGVSSAVYLQRLGASVILIDRRGAGEETSFGNTGIIQREAIHPSLMPRNLIKLTSYALNQKPDVRYQVSSLLETLPFLARYWQHSGQRSAKRGLLASIPLLEQSLACHSELAEAGKCQNLLFRNGYIRVFRRARPAHKLRGQLAELASFGLDAAFIEDKELGALEPHLDRSRIEAAVHYRDPWTVSDPGELVKSHARLFASEGGQFLPGDAATVRRNGNQWVIDTEAGETRAEKIVVALGPWSKDFLVRLGFKLPIGIKRGYHLHYRQNAGTVMNRPVADDENGFALAPMRRGIRLTTGIEFATLQAEKTPVQLKQVLPRAKELFPIGECIELEPWVGARPVLPDALPAIGQARNLQDVWLNVGHGHLGLTFGPVTGKLLAQMMCGATPLCDPQPYSVHRFSTLH